MKNIVLSMRGRLVDLLYFLPIISFTALLLFLSNYGFDLTDESYYLLWTFSPEEYSVGSSAFGYLLHPIAWLVGGNFVFLRMINIVITGILGFVLFSTLIRQNLEKLRLSRRGGFLLASFLSVSVFMNFSGLLLTPSYNSLAFQGLLVIAIFFLELMNNKKQKTLLFSFSVGSALAVIFFAKPTSGIFAGILLSIITLLAIPFAKSLKIFIHLLFGVITTSSIILIYLISQGVAFPQFFIDGAKLLQLFDSSYSFSNIIRLDLNFEFKIAILIVSIFFTLWTFTLELSRGRSKTPYIWLGILLIELYFLGNFYNLVSLSGWGSTHFFFFGFIGTLFFVLLSALKKTWITPTRNLLVVTIGIFTLPWIFVLGTNGNYFAAESKASVFWILAILIILVGTQPTDFFKPYTLVIFTAITAFIVVLGLIDSIVVPYRQPSLLTSQYVPIEIGSNHTVVRVTNQFSLFIDSVNKSASRAGFDSGTPIIDLTGESPGIAYILNGTTASQPWLIGGYPGSISFVEEVLHRTSCEKLNRAWILYSDENARFISPAVLEKVNLNLSNDYDLVASWMIPSGYGSSGNSYRQGLYKPNRPLVDTATNCIR